MNDVKSKFNFGTQYTYAYSFDDGTVFTEPSMTDTSPSSFEPIEQKVARILRGEIIPTSDIYYDVDEKDTLEDAFSKLDPTEDSMFDLADVTEMSLGDEIIQKEQKDNSGELDKQTKGENTDGQANNVSADGSVNSGS